MKKSVYLSIAILFASTSAGLAENAELNVKGMFCVGCASKVEKTLNKTPGVQSVQVNYEQNRALIEYDTTKLNPDKLAETVTDIGFESTVSR